MSISGMLSIGASGMAAASHGSQLVSHNASNAATEGYTRRTLDLEPVRLDYGGGATSGSVTRVEDALLEKRSLGAEAYASEGDAQVAVLSVLDSVFADQPGGIGQALDDFEAALADLASHPSESAARQQLLSRAASLAEAFNRAGAELDTAHSDANARVSSEVESLNSNLERIADLNQKIAQGVHEGRDIGDLQDERGRLIHEVAQAVPVSMIYHDNGAVSLNLAGSYSLVSEDGRAQPLTATTDPTSGDVRIYRSTSGALQDITSLIHSGSIGGALAARDGALADARANLDQLAFDLASAYNAQHAAGAGADGSTGLDLFDVSATADGAARAIGLSADVAGQPSRVAAAGAVGSGVGNNDNALALLGLRDALLAEGGLSSSQQAFANLVAQAGVSLRDAQDNRNHAQASLQQVQQLRESISGVSTDEEMISLMRFQRAYQASMQVIQTADSMLEELLRMRG